MCAEISTWAGPSHADGMQLSMRARVSAVAICPMVSAHPSTTKPHRQTEGQGHTQLSMRARVSAVALPHGVCPSQHHQAAQTNRGARVQWDAGCSHHCAKVACASDTARHTHRCAQMWQWGSRAAAAGTAWPCTGAGHRWQTAGNSRVGGWVGGGGRGRGRTGHSWQQATNPFLAVGASDRGTQGGATTLGLPYTRRTPHTRRAHAAHDARTLPKLMGNQPAQTAAPHGRTTPKIQCRGTEYHARPDWEAGGGGGGATKEPASGKRGGTAEGPEHGRARA